MVVRRLLGLALLVWIGRWAVLQLASYVGRRLPPGPPAKDSPRQPGRLPGPFDFEMPDTGDANPPRRADSEP